MNWQLVTRAFGTNIEEAYGEPTTLHAACDAGRKFRGVWWTVREVA